MIRLVVYFTSLMDLCHLKHAELAKHHQQHRGRFVHWEDNVKDDNGFKVFFTEQSATSSNGTSKTSGYNCQTFQSGRKSQRRGTFLHASTHAGSYQIVETTGEGMLTIIDKATTKSRTNTTKNLWFLLNETQTPFGRTASGKKTGRGTGPVLRNPNLLGNVLTSIEKLTYFGSYMLVTSRFLSKKI